MVRNREQDDDRYRVLVEHASDIVFTLDLNGNFTSVNPAGERLSGYSREEALALNLAEVVVPEHLGLAREMIRRKVMGEVENTRYPLAILSKDGQRVELEVSTWLTHRDGEPPEIQGIARDMTERERLLVRERAARAEAEAARSRYHELMEDLGVIVWEADPETWLFTFVSQFAEDLLGYPIQRWLSEPDFWVHLIHPEDRERAVESCMRATEEGRDNDFEYRMVASDGRVLWVRDIVHVHTDADGKVRQLRGVMIDITGGVLAEAERGRLLGREQAARAEAEAALKARDQFLSSAAHELRTPLATISAYIDLLRAEVEGEQPDGAQNLDVIQRQVLRLRRLVDELVDVSRLNLGRLELYRRRLELGDLAWGILREMQSTSPEHRLVLEREAPVWVEADGYRIEQVLLNLLSNAIKHSPEGSDVTVRVGIHDGSALVTVHDEGIGIPKERQDRLFERFYRAHTDAAGAVQGIGLGLFISREFIERHQGRIWCESAEGKGSTFSFSLPLAK